MTVKLELWIANVPEVRIADALTHHIDGFHIDNGVGYWQTVGETSTHVTIIGLAPNDAILATVTELAAQHGEEAILYAVTNEFGFFASLAEWDAEKGGIHTSRVH